jgi:hypothetical protein
MSWRLSNTLEMEFCLDEFEVAVGCGHEKINISWSGKTGCDDNILVKNGGDRSSTKKPLWMPPLMAEMPESAWPTSCGSPEMADLKLPKKQNF